MSLSAQKSKGHDLVIISCFIDIKGFLCFIRGNVALYGTVNQL